MPLSNKKSLSVILIIVFFIMLLFSCLTPMVSDDFSYSFSWVDNSRITSLRQIIPSMSVHRQLTNGRVFSHGIAQVMLMLPKIVFNILNAGNAVLLCLLICKLLIVIHYDNISPALLVLVLLLWNFTPAFGQNYLWLDGAVNYGWGLTFFLLFLYPFVSKLAENSWDCAIWKKLLYFPIAFIAGAYSESGSICIIFLAFCILIYCLVKKRSFLFLLLLFITSGCGFLFLMTAPATAGRSGDGSLSSLANNLMKILVSARENLLWLYIIFAALFTFCSVQKVNKKVLIISGVLFLTNLASLLSYSFALYFIPRHFCYSVFFTSLACTLLTASFCQTKTELSVRILLSALAVLFLFQFATGFIDVSVSYHKSTEREQIISTALSKGNSSVTLEAFYPTTPYGNIYRLALDDPQSWPNTSIADYYGLETVYGVLPSS